MHHKRIGKGWRKEGWMGVFTLTLGVKRGIIAMCRLVESLILFFNRTIENRGLNTVVMRSRSWRGGNVYGAAFSDGIDSRWVLKGFDWKAV